MFSRLDFILDLRLKGKSRIVGFVILGAFFVSLLVFLLAGNGRVERILYFPREHGGGFVAERRFLTRHGTLEGSITEFVDGMLLGPARHDAVRLFARGATVRAAIVRGHTLYLDLTPQVLDEDPELPLAASRAFDELKKSIHYNFPRVHEIVLYIDGQIPRLSQKKNI